MEKITPAQESFAEFHCYACGPKADNPAGLGLIFEETGDGARTFFTLPADFESYPGFLHGGVVAAVLDETMGYVGVFKQKVLPMTKRLEVTFRYGVKAGVRYECVARLDSATDDGYHATASIKDHKGRSHMLASGDFARLPASMARRMMPDALERFPQYFPSV